MISAFIAAFANAAEVISDKLLLGKKNINYKNFLTISMFFISLAAGVASVFFGSISAEFFTTKFLIIFLGIIVCAFFYNIFFFYALSRAELCDVEPIVLLDRPLAVILAALFFSRGKSIFTTSFYLNWSFCSDFF